MDLAIAVAVGVFIGLLAGLKIIAPKTKNKVDDKAVEYGEKAEPFVRGLVK